MERFRVWTLAFLIEVKAEIVSQAHDLRVLGKAIETGPPQVNRPQGCGSTTGCLRSGTRSDGQTHSRSCDAETGRVYERKPLSPKTRWNPLATTS